MTVQADSRYANGEVVTVLLPDLTTSSMLWQAPLTIDGLQFQFYTVVGGDRLDLIANRLYNDPTKWWLIADMNPELMWPGELTAGSLLRVPLTSVGSAPATQQAFTVTSD